MEQDEAVSQVTEEEKGNYRPEDALGKQNITSFFEKAVLDTLGFDVMEDYSRDADDFQEKLDKIEAINKLILQVSERKSYPFEGASNVKYPLLTKACMQFASIAYPAILKDGKVAKTIVLGDDSGDEPMMDPISNQPLTNPETNKVMRINEGLKARKGEAITKVINYQLLEDMDNWVSDTDRNLFVMSGVGFAYRKFYWCPLENKLASRVIMPQHLIVNIDAPSIKQASRLSEEIELYPWQVEEYVRAGVFDEDFKLETSSQETLGTNREDMGDAPTNGDTRAPHIFIEQYRRIDLDDDGYAEPYTVVVHKQSSQVVRIIARYSAKDIERDANDKVMRIGARDLIVKYAFLPSPEGSFYDIGYGDLLLPINESVNTSINNLFDAGHMSVMSAGFIGRGLRMKTGMTSFRPFEWKVVDTAGGKIRDNVFPLPINQPSPVILELLASLVKAGEDVASLSRLMAGEMPNNMPATTTMAAVEQSLTPFKAIFKRIYQAIKEELKIICYLNSEFLDVTKYKKKLGIEITKKDFDTEDLDILPVADPDIVSNMQRLAKAQILMEMKDDPYINPIEARKEVLRASGYSDIERFLMVPPPPQPQAADIVAQAQAKALEAQAQNLATQAEATALKTRAEIENTLSDSQLQTAKAVESLAKAENLKTTSAIEQFNELERRLNGNQDSGRAVDSMAQPSNN